MGMRRVREGLITLIGWFPHYIYEGPNGNVYKGVRHEVQIVTVVQDGPDKGREVRVTMSIDEARKHIAEIEAAIERADQKARAYEGLEDPE